MRVDTGLLFLWFIARELIKSYNLDNKKNQFEINTRQKRLLTITICEVFGLTNLVLLMFCTGKDDPLTLICVLPCAFLMVICQNVKFPANVPMALGISITFLLQLVIYAIIGLIISIYVCRKKKSSPLS